MYLVSTSNFESDPGFALHGLTSVGFLTPIWCWDCILKLYPKIGHKLVLVDAHNFVENYLLLLFYTSNSVMWSQLLRKVQQIITNLHLNKSKVYTSQYRGPHMIMVKKFMQKYGWELHPRLFLKNVKSNAGSEALTLGVHHTWLLPFRTESSWLCLVSQCKTLDSVFIWTKTSSCQVSACSSLMTSFRHTRAVDFCHWEREFYVKCDKNHSYRKGVSISAYFSMGT